ncbi:452_t:CDS:2, partial [Racocetra fulgida]
TQRYAITIKRSRSDINDEIKNMTLGCNRSGYYRNRLNLTENSRHRQTSSKLLNCLFKLFASRCNNTWSFEVRNSEHNYQPSKDMSVNRMAAAGSCPHQILSTIHLNDLSLMAISKTIYNELYSIRQERLDSRTPIQALLNELQGSDFEFEYQ